MLSIETIDVLQEILGECAISLGHPDFDNQAQRLGTAKRELTAARAEALAAAEEPAQE